MTRSRTIVGIDLGTTYSLVAHLGAHGPQVLPNRLGETLTPSAVSVADDGRVLVGAAARARAVTHPHQTAVAFKRDMGTTASRILGSQTMTAIELSALVLAELKQDAEAYFGHEIDEAVVTVPAYFGELQRAATRDAAAIAGLRVERIINEPTAAALAYGLHQGGREAKLVVLDLGGGTFDVTVLELIEGVIEIQATAGDIRLGGEDFTDALEAHVHARLVEAGALDPSTLVAQGKTHSVAKARLREAIERAKYTLSEHDSAVVAVPALAMGSNGPVDIALPLTRTEAETAWAPLFERLRLPILRALRDAQVSPSVIDEVLLVGGATRMPSIARLAANIFGRLPLRSLPPDEAVALGAAVQAALKAGSEAVEDLVVTDVAPFTMGVEVADVTAAQLVFGVYSPILERGTVIPASRVKRLSTLQDFQTELVVQVFQGEHSLTRDNTRLGTYRLTKLPRARSGEVQVDVRFTYDLNGLLEVEMTVVGSSRVETMLIESTPGRLTPAERDAAREAMRALKFDPREALPNTVALARGDQLYMELLGEPREILGRLLTTFRAVLERQDPAEIEAVRAHLIAVTNSLSGR